MQDVVANVPYMVSPGNHEVVVSAFGVGIYIRRKVPGKNQELGISN
jgi:hypothetical protein